MRRIILLCLLFLAGVMFPVFSNENEVDTTNKVIVESLEDFSVDNNCNTVKFKVLKENSFENGITFEKDSIISAKAARVVEPKRGKRNGYLVIAPESYTVPSKNNENIKINDEYWFANVVGYKPFDVKKAAFGAGLGVAGHFIKGIGQIFYFGKGIIAPNEGEGRLKSDAKMYTKTHLFVILKKGKRLISKQGMFFF